MLLLCVCAQVSRIHCWWESHLVLHAHSGVLWETASLRFPQRQRRPTKMKGTPSLKYMVKARASDPRIPRKSKEVGKAGRVQSRFSRTALPNRVARCFLRLLEMAAMSQTLPCQMTTQSPLRVKAPRAALVPSPRRQSCTVRAAATGPGPKPKGDLIQNVRQGCDNFLQVISLGKFASGHHGVLFSNA